MTSRGEVWSLLFVPPTFKQMVICQEGLSELFQVGKV